MITCKFCNRECKNDNSMRNHQRLCNNNPDKQTTIFHNLHFQKNKKKSNSAIKAKEEGRVHIVDDETLQKISAAVKARTPEFNKAYGRKISKTVIEKVINGEWHSSIRKMYVHEYRGELLHCSWELAYAKYLDANNIKWVRCKNTFAYTFEGKIRRYTPDFYLPDTNEYIEIKGYETEKDRAKWAQFPETLIVLKEKELKQMKVI